MPIVYQEVSEDCHSRAASGRSKKRRHTGSLLYKESNQLCRLFAMIDTSHRRLRQRQCLYEKLGLDQLRINRSGTLQRKYWAQYCVNAVPL
jgi:hypothetical protein